MLSFHVMMMAFWQPCKLTQTHASHCLAQGRRAEDKPRKSPGSLRSICVSSHTAGSAHGIGSLHEVWGVGGWRVVGMVLSWHYGATFLFGHHQQDFLMQPNQLPPVCLGKGRT